MRRTARNSPCMCCLSEEGARGRNGERKGMRKRKLRRGDGKWEEDRRRRMGRGGVDVGRIVGRREG